ncbi:F0F1 ATP synthase subunit B [Mariluticola halotolerans]|uniref:F0F1 ATP synthase subunit B n=1 Tax=Mariluticola halotolerans TaxID=2909283 RepID=UPI0026E31F6C|nr:F0F1 ATP synthase subunit B [Mariluticola halotolerans]UJQ95835.1 F0F1 ATP synthase subunit B [Mariluticola halotolerans]
MTGTLVAQENAVEHALEELEQSSEVDGVLHHTQEGTLAHGGEDAHSSAFPPFDSSTFGSQLLWLAIAFGLLYVLMSRVALPRIGEILEVRRDRIEGDLAEAERMRQKTDQALADYEKALADAKAKSQGIAEATRSKVKTELDAKRTKVEADLSKKMSEAETRIQATKAEAMGNVGEIAVDTAQALVAQLLGKVPVKSARDAVAKVVKEQA